MKMDVPTPSMQNTSKVTARSRVFSLFVGLAYLAILARLYGQLTGWSPALATFAVVLAATTNIAVIALFCAKWVTQEEVNRGVRLSTLFLLYIPISIYLALYSQLLQAIRTDAPDVDVAWWIILLPFSLFAAFTTILLLWFGEAVVWLLVCCRRAWVNQRRSNHL